MANEAREKGKMLSIVVCTRNRPELLRCCLEALASQDGNFEVVVVDQGEAPVVIPADARFRYLTDRERGLAAGRNTGVRAVTGSIIAFLDDDAVPDAGYVRALEKEFTGDAGLAAAAGRILTLEDGRPYTRVHDGTLRVLGRRDWLRFLGGNFAIRRRVLDEVGPFDERFGAGRRWASGEETDYFFRMQYRNCRVAYVPAVIVRHPREELGRVTKKLRAKLFDYARGQGAVIARHLLDFDNCGMIGTLVWEVGKPSLRLIENVLALRWHSALLYVNVAWGKCVGFAEFLFLAMRKSC